MPDMFAPLTVAWIDDEPMSTQLGCLMLQRALNATIVGTAPTAETGAELVQRTQPAVIVLDDMMPGLCCEDAVRHVRPAVPNAVILLRTHRYREAAYVQALLEAGANRVIPYGPYLHNELVDAVREAAANSKTTS